MCVFVYPDISDILKDTNWPKIVIDGDVVMVLPVRK
jgi:hypothetical protein